jgi:hypothetical protein
VDSLQRTPIRYLHAAWITVVLVALLACCTFSSSEAKPRLKVAPDGFPTGQATPEGTASDLARAFMKRDVTLFRSVCIRPYGKGRARTEYPKYLDGVSDHLKQQKESLALDDPKEISKVFAARHLSRNGPASYGYAGFDFQDVMFVDVEVMLNSGSKHLRRTLVIKDRDQKWYVQPVPDVDPLLSYGLYDEKPSVQSFADVYEIQR